MNGGAGKAPDPRERELAALRRELQEANETLDAIRNGEVDAVVVGGPAGQMVYTLENADRPYRVLVEQMGEGAVTFATGGTILYTNRSFASLVGRKSQDIVGRNLSDFIEDRAALQDLLANGARTHSGEANVLTAAHTAVPVNLSLVELAVEEGEAPLLCAIVTDLSENYARARESAQANARLAAEITERRRAEDSLAIALDAADMASWDLGLETDTANRSARHDAMFGYPQMLPTWSLAVALKHFVPEDRDAVVAAFEDARTTGRVEFEKRIRRANDGALRWLHIKGRTFYGERGAERIAGVVIDVTERRLIDEQLRQAQKMEAIGQLTGGVAHDFNNLLMIIGGSLQALSRRVVLDERAQKFLDAAQLGVARGAKLNEQLLAFARRQDLQAVAFCINDLLPEFETLLDRALGEAVEVQIRRGADLWHCAADPHQLETAILNLAINARDAMGPGGTLTLATVNAVVPEADAGLWDGPPGEYVVVSVSDTGSGMTPELVAKAFEPFFTTKDMGKGTGLGLSQVYGFAKQSDGFVAIESELGRGTKVSIFLPRAEPRPQVLASEPLPGGLDEACGVVLLVEDDADVRTATAAMLEALGYTVREAASGQAALHALQSDTHVDVVFTDVIMASGMTGVELARRINAEHPALPVLLTSGYTAQRVIPAAANGNLPLLRKPYTLETMNAALRSAIEEKRKDVDRSAPGRDQRLSRAEGATSPLER
ncbi:MAG: ATP-binding protein [Caulobacterales bacterium]